jgi:hypothetical protein
MQTGNKLWIDLTKVISALLLQHPILTGRESNPGKDEHSSKELFEQLINRCTGTS